ncbi:hypothetical protein [Streptomyces sp. NPDC057702]|uniref:hypothetical protein n=1 Tax=unclassified Streptomyces TaxID=2593676 RepID=UPI00369CFB9D
MAGAARVTGASLCAPPAARAAGRVVGERRLDERLVAPTPRSPALGRTGPVALLTPHGWDRRRPGGHWPTRYLLAGGNGDHTVWTERFHVQGLVELHDVLVVMPAMPVFGFWADRWNHGAGGAPRTRAYFPREVLPLVQRDHGAGHAGWRRAGPRAVSGPWDPPHGAARPTGREGPRTPRATRQVWREARRREARRRVARASPGRPVPDGRRRRVRGGRE